MADIFREVDEDVRRDKALEFWTKYQAYLIALAVLIVIGTAGWRYYETRRQQAAEDAGARYEAAVQLSRDGKSAEAEKALQEIAGSADPGYALLAKFRRAGEVATRDKFAGAKLFDELAAAPDAGALFQDMARLRAAMLLVDTADAVEMSRRLEPMAAPTGAFRASAREILAYSAIRRDDMQGAGRWLDLIVSDPQSPATLKQRAEALLGLVAGAGKPADKPAGTTNP